MKKLLILLGFLVVSNFCYAEVYMTYDKESQEVIDVSKRKDVVLQPGWERIGMPGTIQDYNAEFQMHPSFYKYKNNRFVQNVKKISDKVLEQERIAEIIEETGAIEEEVRSIAIERLKGKGKNIKYYTDDGKLKEE